MADDFEPHNPQRERQQILYAIQLRVLFLEKQERLLGQILGHIPRYMRCREGQNPFTQLDQDRVALHWVTVIEIIALAFFAVRYNPGVARVLMVSSEAAPLAKTGGLADVVGILPDTLH